MTMTKHSEQLPEELERLAEYYDTHDTNTEMDNGEWVELHEITERLNRIERALSAGLPHDDQKTA
jgi:hypothetical protein